MNKSHLASLIRPLRDLEPETFGVGQFFGVLSQLEAKRWNRTLNPREASTKTYLDQWLCYDKQSTGVHAFMGWLVERA